MLTASNANQDCKGSTMIAVSVDALQRLKLYMPNWDQAVTLLQDTAQSYYDKYGCVIYCQQPMPACQLAFDNPGSQLTDMLQCMLAGTKLTLCPWEQMPRMLEPQCELW
jgi:hypothetical protein